MDAFEIEELFDHGSFVGLKLNEHNRIAIFITREESQAGWTTASQAIDVAWNLYMLYWDEDRDLLFINSSAKGPFDKLAKAVCGEKTRRIEGDDVFVPCTTSSDLYCATWD